jgi:hypothetical protein
VEQVWLENGRFVSAGSGVLVVRVLERQRLLLLGLKAHWQTRCRLLPLAR